MKMKAAVQFQAGGPLIIDEVELAEPQYHEVLVRNIACGICRTDEHGRHNAAQERPVVLGHETAGIVEQVGAGVRGFRPGDRVVMSYPSCGECGNCRSGQPYYCENWTKLAQGRMMDGSTRLRYQGRPVLHFFGQGGFAAYSVCHVRNLVRVAPDLDLRILGPLGCSVQTGAGALWNTLASPPGSSVVIFGAGAVGLSAVMAAKAAAYGVIIAVDIVPKRLKAALELGATHAVNNRDPHSLMAEIMGVTGNGADCSFDTTGVSSCVTAALRCLHRGGRSCTVGGGGQLTFDDWSGIMIGRTLSYTVEGCAIPQVMIPRIIEQYRRGRMPFDKMITFFPFDQINEAFAAQQNGEVIKPVLLMA